MFHCVVTVMDPDAAPVVLEKLMLAGVALMVIDEFTVKDKLTVATLLLVLAIAEPIGSKSNNAIKGQIANRLNVFILFSFRCRSIF